MRVDPGGYRMNVGIILANNEGKVFWARRVGQNAWQFPQGGLDENEEPVDAMYRELKEEIGLEQEDVELLAATKGWIHYRLPKHMIRYTQNPLVVGQKQKWYLLRLVGPEQNVRFDVTGKPEFDDWRWVDYWHPMEEVIYFKKDVYQTALEELEGTLFPEKRFKRYSKGPSRKYYKPKKQED